MQRNIQVITAFTFTLIIYGYAPDLGATSNCPLIEDEAARVCCERSLPEHSMRQTITMAVIDDKGTVSNLSAEFYWKRFDDKRARARIELTNPPRQSGTVVLLTESETEQDGAPREPEVVLYKPGERRDRLISISALSGEMFGTDFSYDDFAHFYGTDADVNVVRLEDVELDGKTHIVLQTTAKDQGAAYDRGSIYSRVLTYLDVVQCVPTLTRFYDEDNKLRKELIATADQIRLVEDRWIPHELTMYDLVEESKTVLTVESIEFDTGINDRMFSRSLLKRGR